MSICPFHPNCTLPEGHKQGCITTPPSTVAQQTAVPDAREELRKFQDALVDDGGFGVDDVTYIMDKLQPVLAALRRGR